MFSPITFLYRLYNTFCFFDAQLRQPALCAIWHCAKRSSYWGRSVSSITLWCHLHRVTLFLVLCLSRFILSLPCCGSKATPRHDHDVPYALLSHDTNPHIFSRLQRLAKSPTAYAPIGVSSPAGNPYARHTSIPRASSRWAAGMELPNGPIPHGPRRRCLRCWRRWAWPRGSWNYRQMSGQRQPSPPIMI